MPLTYNHQNPYGVKNNEDEGIVFRVAVFFYILYHCVKCALISLFFINGINR